MISAWRSRDHSYPAIVATAFLVFVALTGLMLGGREAVAYVATAGVLWFPGMVGYVFGVRKKQATLVREVRDSLQRVEASLAGEPRLAVVRSFPRPR